MANRGKTQENGFCFFMIRTSQDLAHYYHRGRLNFFYIQGAYLAGSFLLVQCCKKENPHKTEGFVLVGEIVSS